MGEIRTVYTFDDAPPPDEFKVKLCGNNHVNKYDDVFVFCGSELLATRYVKQVCDDYYIATNEKPPKPPSISKLERMQLSKRNREARQKRNEEIKRLYDEGYRVKDIAMAYGLVGGTIWQIAKKKGVYGRRG